MRKIVLPFLLIFILVIWSCKPQMVEDEPEDLIAMEKFKQMVVDFHLLEAYVEKEYGNTDSAMVIFKQLEEDLCEKHKTTKDLYLKSHNYYLRNTELKMDVIYEDVVKELSKLEARTKAAEKKEEKSDDG